MLLHLIWLIIFTFHAGSSEDLIKPFKDVMLALEGDRVTLSCNYSVSVDNLYWYRQYSSSSPQLLIMEYSQKISGLSFKQEKERKEFHLEISSAAVTDSFYWYRQDPGKPPQFLISHLGTGSLSREADPNSGLSVKVTKEETQMDLEISSAAVTDSALYYCAVKPTVTGNPESLYKNSPILIFIFYLYVIKSSIRLVSFLTAFIMALSLAPKSNYQQPKEGNIIKVG
ncbi:uncharacterized protein LOC144542162 [Centroberyx gerrardi]